MSGQTNFTAGRENTLNDAIQNLMSQFDFSHRNSPEYRLIVARVTLYRARYVKLVAVQNVFAVAADDVE